MIEQLTLIVQIAVTLQSPLTSTLTSGSTCATCNTTCNRTLQNLYRLHIFNKLEVSRLDSRLSSLFIISSYIHTLSWCQKVVGFSRNWENLTAIKLINKSDILSWCQRVVRSSRNWEHLTAI